MERNHDLSTSLDILEGLNDLTGRNALLKLFGQFGKILACWLCPVETRHYERSYVKFATVAAAEAAMEASEANLLYNHGVRVKCVWRQAHKLTQDSRDFEGHGANVQSSREIMRQIAQERKSGGGGAAGGGKSGRDRGGEKGGGGGGSRDMFKNDSRSMRDSSRDRDRDRDRSYRDRDRDRDRDRRDWERRRSRSRSNRGKGRSREEGVYDRHHRDYNADRDCNAEEALERALQDNDRRRGGRDSYERGGGSRSRGRREWNSRSRSGRRGSNNRAVADRQDRYLPLEYGDREREKETSFEPEEQDVGGFDNDDTSAVI